MRFLLTVFSILCLGTSCLFAAGLDKVMLNITGVSTTATASVSISDKFTGFIERVDVWFSVTTNASHMQMIVSNEYTGLTTTLFPNTVKGTNFSYSPVMNLTDTSGNVMGTNGTSGKILVFDEKVYLIATNAVAGATAQNIKARIIYERK